MVKALSIKIHTNPVAFTPPHFVDGIPDVAHPYPIICRLSLDAAPDALALQRKSYL